MTSYRPIDRRPKSTLITSVYDLAAGLAPHSNLARDIQRHYDLERHRKYNAKCEMPDTKFTYWRKDMARNKQVYERYPLTTSR